MDVVEVNYLAVLVAAIAYIVIGFVWYSDVLFGKLYRKEMGVKEGMKPGKDFMTKMMALGSLSALIMAYVLSHNIAFSGAYLGASGPWLGLMTGFWLWLGYQVIILLTAIYMKANQLN